MSLSGAGQFVAHLGYVHSCAQLGDCTLMCPVGRLYTHVPSWATVHSCAQLGDCTLMCPIGRLYTHVPSWATVHSCAQLGDCTLMCPIGRLYTHVPSWAIVHSCAQLGDCTHMCPVGQLYTHVPSWAMVHSVGQWYTRSQYNAHVQLDYSSDPFGILSRIKMVHKARDNSSDQAYAGVVYIDCLPLV